jgi:glycosyltransferase involved in cell wall biosynthesis
MLARKTKYLVTVGRKVADELLEVGIGVKSQYRSIGPGVTALVLQDREQSRIELGISEELRPVIIWMARITSVKAPKRVAEIAKFIPEAKFLLVGGGDMLDEVAANLPGNVSIVGWQEATTIWAVADLAISTSENEGMPIALIEANLAGVPAIALNVGSVSEVIVSGITGYLFEAFGTDYILKVREIISNKTELRLLGQTAKEYAKVQFVPEKMIRLHLELFEAVLKKT